MQRQNFTFSQSGEDCQIEKDSELLRHGPGQCVITNLILDAGIIYSAVTSRMDFIGLFNVFQESVNLRRGEKLDFVSSILTSCPNLITGISVYNFPVHGSFEN